jgi:hypothetical protein
MRLIFSTKPSRSAVEAILSEYISDQTVPDESLYWQEPGQLSFQSVCFNKKWMK